MLTQPNDTEAESLESWGKAFLKQKYNKPGNVFLHAVHRLDKPVCGIVLFARTSKALSRLNAALREQKVVKIYLAEVEGCLRQESGTLRHFLKKEHFKTRVIEEDAAKAKEAALRYAVVARNEKICVLQIELLSGRYHQIRAQLSAAGHPIVGDVKYGGKDAPQMMLCHAYMEFMHPVTGESLSITLSKIWNAFKAAPFKS